MSTKTIRLDRMTVTGPDGNRFEFGASGEAQIELRTEPPGHIAPMVLTDVRHTVIEGTVETSVDLCLLDRWRELTAPVYGQTIASTTRDVRGAGGTTFCADDDGYVSVGGYSEEIGWFRDLLALRYGDAHVSPVVHPEGENARFTFFLDMALSHNPLWKMYWDIDSWPAPTSG